MARHRSFPSLYDECKTISITDLKRLGYLTPDQYKAGTLSWSLNGNRTGSISVIVNTLNNDWYLELDYNCNKEPVNYRVRIISVLSNLGKGNVLFFICPHTGKRCRKLYLISKYFLHREAFRGCFYESQTYSRSTRELEKFFDRHFAEEHLFAALNKPYFKRSYRGKPTKRYLRLLRKYSSHPSDT